MSNKTFRNNILGIILSILIFAGFIGAFQLGRNSAGTRSAQKKILSNNKSKKNVDENETKTSLPEITKQTKTSTSIFYGTAAPVQQANVQSTQGGKITLLSGDIGGKVKKGDEIVKFDNTELQLEIKKAESEKKSAMQQIKQSKSAFETTGKEKNRILGLKKKGMVSESEADSMIDKYRTAETNLHRARESAIQIGVRIQLLNESLKDCVVTSPISGLIDSRHYNLKEIYRAGDTIFHVVDIDKIYLNVKIPEVVINKMYVGKKTEVRFEAIPETVYSGIVQKIPPGQGSDYRSYTIEVLIDNVDHKIKPGMFGKAEFEI